MRLGELRPLSGTKTAATATVSLANSHSADFELPIVMEAPEVVHDDAIGSFCRTLLSFLPEFMHGLKFPTFFVRHNAKLA